MASKKQQRKIIDSVLTGFGIVAMIALISIGGLAWWASGFITSNVHDQLAEQKVFFPAKNSPAFTSLPASDQAEVSKYAGQQVLTGAQAQVFANNYIAVHLKEIAGGQTYSEVSAKALANPTNAQLQGQANTLFKGETLRGLLLGDAYAFGTMGMIARDAAVVAFVAAALMGILTLLGYWHLSTVR